MLDGATDPTSTTFEVVLAQSEGFENALRAYLEGCPALGECPFTGSVRRESPPSFVIFTTDSEMTHPELRTGDFFDSAVLDIATSPPPSTTRRHGASSAKMFAELRTGEVGTGFLLAASTTVVKAVSTSTTRSICLWGGGAFIAINCLATPWRPTG